jgi:hypothetical protein
MSELGALFDNLDLCSRRQSIISLTFRHSFRILLLYTSRIFMSLSYYFFDYIRIIVLWQRASSDYNGFFHTENKFQSLEKFLYPQTPRYNLSNRIQST